MQNKSIHLITISKEQQLIALRDSNDKTHAQLRDWTFKNMVTEKKNVLQVNSFEKCHTQIQLKLMYVGKALKSGCCCWWIKAQLGLLITPSKAA